MKLIQILTASLFGIFLGILKISLSFLKNITILISINTSLTLYNFLVYVDFHPIQQTTISSNPEFMNLLICLVITLIAVRKNLEINLIYKGSFEILFCSLCRRKSLLIKYQIIKLLAQNNHRNCSLQRKHSLIEF